MNDENVFETPILAELQRLFAKLLSSKRHSLSTVDLLDSFGWSKSERVEQHDVHEFFTVLLEAIGMESPSFYSSLSKTFLGFNRGRLN